MSEKKKRVTYSGEFKLEAVKYAEENSNSKAAEHFRVNMTQISRWRHQKEALQKLPKKSAKVVKRERSCNWPELEINLKSWLVDQRNKGFQISGASILREARALAIRLNIPSFKGSSHWVHKFMRRNKIVRRAVTSVGQKLPDDWEQKMATFVEFINSHKDDYSLDHIANMDEVPVTFDMPSNFTMEQKGTNDVRVVTSGAEKSRFTVVLCVTASLQKLPAYVIFRRKTIPKGNFPSNVVVTANEKACMNASETILWHEKIWMKRKGVIFHQKSLLMLDAAPGHRTSEVKTKFKQQGTQMAMIPGGLTKKLQVLDLCVNKSFKSRLRSKWENWLINGYKEYTKSGNMKRASYSEICKWIGEAWQEVPSSTIKNGFNKTTINFFNSDQIDNDDYETESEDDLLIEESEDEGARNALFDIIMDEENFASEDEIYETDEDE